jgi:hypothetical protein
MKQGCHDSSHFPAALVIHLATLTEAPRAKTSRPLDLMPKTTYHSATWNNDLYMFAFRPSNGAVVAYLPVM